MPRFGKMQLPYDTLARYTQLYLSIEHMHTLVEGSLQVYRQVSRGSLPLYVRQDLCRSMLDFSGRRHRMIKRLGHH